MEEGVDDVAFVAALIDQLDGELAVDRERVFATGVSNGGMMAYWLAVERSDLVRAIAPVAA